MTSCARGLASGGRSRGRDGEKLFRSVDPRQTAFNREALREKNALAPTGLPAARVLAFALPMRRWFPLPRFWVALVFAVLPAAAHAEPALSLPNGSPLLAPGATPEKIVGGLGHCEGPAWHPDGFLLFCNPPQNRILKLDADGALATFRAPCGRATALWFDADGRLVANESHGGTEGARRLSRREKDGAWLTLADRFNGRRLNSPNDLAIDSRGRIFFTDPRYSARETMELAHESVYRIDPGGALARLDIALTRPNGILVTPDGKTLLVADNPASGAARASLWAFDLDSSGKAQGGRIIYDFRSSRGIDGMTFDTADRVWATAGIREDAGLYVFEIDPRRNNARRVAFFALPETPTNCTFGGPRRDTLYITTDDALYRLRTAVTGRAGPPGK